MDVVTGIFGLLLVPMWSVAIHGCGRWAERYSALTVLHLRYKRERVQLREEAILGVVAGWQY